MSNPIKYRDGYKYQLATPHVEIVNIKPLTHIGHDFIILSPAGDLIIKDGYAWDGPSGPTIDTKNFMRGSLVHDALYQLMREGLLDGNWREEADKELRRICQEDGMSWVRAWWVFKGVRIGGSGSAAKQREEILIAP